METSQAKCISNKYHKHTEREKKELTLVTFKHSIWTTYLKTKKKIAKPMMNSSY